MFQSSRHILRIVFPGNVKQDLELFPVLSSEVSFKFNLYIVIFGSYYFICIFLYIFNLF